MDAAEQARFFVDHAKPHGLFDDDALAPMYDAENWEGGGLVWPSPKILNDHIAEHIRVVREETGVRRHLVYGSLSWWGTWIDPDLWADDDVLLWIAVYNGQPGDLEGWSHPNDALHQHTSGGVVPGVAGNVDKNVTLPGRTIGDLVIKQEDDMAVFTQEQIDLVVRAAHKVVDEFDPTADDRPLAINTPDDLTGHVLSVRGLQEKMRNAEAIDRVAIANIETLVNRIDQREAAGGMSEADRDALAADIAAKLPENVDTQAVINALLGVQGTVTYRTRPTGG